MKGTILAAAAASLIALSVAGSALATTPGRNGRILYQREVNGKGQLFTVRPDGTGRRQLTRGPTESVNGSWSPDGKSIVFEQSDDVRAGVMIMNADGSNVRNLTPTGYQGDPSFTPDGRADRVHAYRRGPLRRRLAHEPRRLESARAAGDEERCPRGGKCGCDVDATVSPDGKTITYIRVVGEWGTQQALMSVGIDGTGLKRLTPPSFEVGIKHDWSPDGKLIVFTSARRSCTRAVGGTVGNEARRIAQDAPHATSRREKNAFAGSFSPNGKWIVFRVEDAKGYHLSRIHPDGTGLHVIANGGVPQRSSSWGTAQ